MRNAYFILIIVACIKNPVDAMSTQCSTTIIQRITHHLKPYQISISEMNTDKLNVLIPFYYKIISNQTASITIDLNNIYQQNSLSTIPKSHDPTYYASSIVILFHGSYDARNDQFSNLKYFIDSIAALHTTLKRPKILVILLDTDLVSEQSLKNIFEYAWSKNILDFSVASESVNVLPNYRDCVLQYFNPFYDIMRKVPINSEVQIFPDKLSDVNGHDFKIGMITVSASVVIRRNSAGEITSVNGPFIPVQLLILEIMNFTVSYVETGYNVSYDRARKLIMDKLQNNEIMMSNPGLFSLNHTSRIAQLDIEKDCNKIIAVAPVIPRVMINISGSIFSNLIIIPLGILIVMYLSEILKIKQEHWSTSVIFKLLFGIPAFLKLPKKVGDMFITLSIIVVSMWYSFNFYSDVLNIQLIRDNVPFDTFKDIDESNLKLYINKVNVETAFWLDDTHVKNIKRKTEDVDDILPCVEDLLMNADHICLTSEDVAESVKMSLPTGHALKFKATKPVFNCQKNVYNFERSSPYFGKFKKNLHKIYAAGLDKRMEHTENDKIESADKIEVQEKSVVLYELKFTFGCGCIISLFVFFGEFMAVKLKYYFIKKS